MRHRNGHLDPALFHLPYSVSTIPLKEEEYFVLLDEERYGRSVDDKLVDYGRFSHSLAGEHHAVPSARPPIAYKSTSSDRSSPISRYICPRECLCFKAVGKRESRDEDGNVCDEQERTSLFAISDRRSTSAGR